IDPDQMVIDRWGNCEQGTEWDLLRCHPERVCASLSVRQLFVFGADFVNCHQLRSVWMVRPCSCINP
ncbi:hypothetical protein KAJ02_02095, partial [Candidatus Bipolaricaulota bacterium]|nr:hypothetical protein [Candidatus Bipolaricaulota bacterium]